MTFLMTAQTVVALTQLESVLTAVVRAVNVPFPES
jgi:hypothetical protein